MPDEPFRGTVCRIEEYAKNIHVVGISQCSPSSILTGYTRDYSYEFTDLDSFFPSEQGRCESRIDDPSVSKLSSRANERSPLVV